MTRTVELEPPVCEFCGDYILTHDQLPRPTRGRPSDLLDREQRMGRQDKLPFAQWGDRSADIECMNAEHDAETTAECDCDPRRK